jgi:hypothetical protein
MYPRELENCFIDLDFRVPDSDYGENLQTVDVATSTAVPPAAPFSEDTSLWVQKINAVNEIYGIYNQGTLGGNAIFDGTP